MNLNRLPDTKEAQVASDEPTESQMEAALNAMLTSMKPDLILEDLSEDEQTAHMFGAAREINTPDSPNS